jgi:predicted deacylase
VLFVAEKRAAIDAVLDRLRRVGLDDLVLDLHDGAGSRRMLAQNLPPRWPTTRRRRYRMWPSTRHGSSNAGAL